MGFLAKTVEVDEEFRVFGVGATRAEAVRRLKQKHSNLSGGQKFTGKIEVLWITNGGANE
jgi:hypothetical protein